MRLLLIALTAFISPYRVDRDRVRRMIPTGEFIEVFVDTPLEVVEQRDADHYLAVAPAHAGLVDNGPHLPTRMREVLFELYDLYERRREQAV